MNPDALAKIGEALAVLVGAFGPGWTVVLILASLAMALAWRVHAGKRADRGFQAALDEKERSIQRLANEVRELRIVLFTKEFRMSKQQAEKLIERNEFASPAESRSAVESRRREEKRARRRKRSRR